MVPSKCDHLKVKKGDVLHYITWGGGGWGNPLERPPALVQQDVRRGLVTLEGAKSNYGVVLTSAHGDVDEAATEATRSDLAVAKSKEKGSGNDGNDGVFDFGFRKGMKATPEEIQALLARCREETGLVAPVLPAESHLDN
jgi:N-methylhydantoinase B